MAAQHVQGLALVELAGDPTSPHALRHAYALRELARGRRLGRLQRRLGHASPATTARYLQALEDAEEHPDAG